MLEEKKGMDILLLDIQSVTILADYFVLCTATSERHLGALAGDLSRQLKADVGRPMGIEGEPGSGWQLIDYGDVVVHLFLAETRVFYDLEGLWKEAQTVVHIH
ncbi:MAG: ribosome silencing factor [Anaerolineae bacterium]|nr:ribosome silencing factor [Anaerolineae bacterium]